jgi:hypothetical protein
VNRPRNARARAEAEAARARADAEAAWDAVVEAAEGAEHGMFSFARRLRAWTWPPNTTAAGVATYLENSYVRYCMTTGENVGDIWDVLGLGESGDPRAEFIVAWERVRVPEGHGLWETVEPNARQYPYIPTVAPSRKYVQFVSLAAHLQRARAQGQTILLPVGRLASMLGTTPQMVSVYRRWAVDAGILNEVQRPDRERRRATEFVFMLDQFDAKRRQLSPK